MNLIPIYYNVSRAIEIAKAGSHTLGAIYTSDPDNKENSVHPKDIEAIEKFFGVKFIHDGDIMVEIMRPSFDELLRTCRGETLEDIENRIKRAQKGDRPEEFNQACFSLLKTAYDRLGLAVYEVELIKDIARTIAKLALTKEVKVEHIAEAIQYRSIDRGEFIKIYGE